MPLKKKVKVTKVGKMNMIKAFDLYSVNEQHFSGIYICSTR